jgi:hypothetical protein
VPIYILVWHFRPEHAVALSNLTITGGAVANLLCNLHRRAAPRPRLAIAAIMSCVQQLGL